ncbi:MAG TPA: c-type cytochrome domain-containing protein [Verrucomicrobiae bacterium]|jgi:hypothetical protein|nr:c-type cytochrome domain-containing protein [Verrucomicrobiae bacterium]
MKIVIALAALLGCVVSQAIAQPENGPKKWDITTVDVSKLPPAATQTGVTFAKDIMPLLKTSCLGCHNAEHPKAGYKLDTLDNALKGGRDGVMIVPGDSQKSLFVVAVARINPRLAMPPTPRGPRPGATNSPAATHLPPPPFSTANVALVRAWIDQGAK